MNIQGKKALVTGAAKRVGRDIALGLAEKGAHILLHYHTSKTEAEQTAQEIKRLGAPCNLFQADLSKSGDIRRLLEEIEKKFNAIDILINSASIFYKTPFAEIQESDWDKFLNANLKGPFLLCHAIGQKMAQTKGGRIINIADWSGLRPYKNYTPYCTSKGALITLTKSLARDLAPKVTVNAVAPGPVLLPPDFSEEEKRKIIEKTPLGRLGTPRDVTNAVCFLLSNDYIHGTVLVVDGGRSIV